MPSASLLGVARRWLRSSAFERAAVVARWAASQRCSLHRTPTHFIFSPSSSLIFFQVREVRITKKFELSGFFQF
jgi:hypothetical protein